MGPSIPQVTFEYFLSSSLPHVDEKIVAKVYASLEKKGLVTDEGWNTMKYDELRKRQAEQREEKEREGDPTNETTDSAGQAKGTIHKDNFKFFNPLADCFNAVLEEANDVLAQDQHWQHALFKFCSNPRSSTASEGTHRRYASDVYALLNESRAVAEERKDNAECDVILPGEYRKTDTWQNRKENIHKLVGAANHIMAYDPTRRFIFGITIEYTNIRFWFFSRSHVFVTESVDLQKEAKQVISFILALGSATLYELGFDLTMERVLSNEEIRYRFLVGGRKYEMTKLVSHSKAKFLLGCVARIFRVKLVLNDGRLGEEEYILKDYYIPEVAKTEKEVLDDIYNKVNKVNYVKGLSRKNLHRYFVQIEACDRVQVRSTNDRNEFVNDNTSNFLRRPFPDNPPRCVLIPNPPYKSQSGTTISGSSLAVRTPGPYSLGTANNRAQIDAIARAHYGYKVHCRLLMKDGGSTLEDIQDLPTLVKCLQQVVRALQYMYSAGYVHRDISTGNILFRHGDNGEIVARLCDLEYAKDISQPGEPSLDVKTGTPHFIAVEVENGHFLYPLESQRSDYMVDFSDEESFFSEPETDSSEVAVESPELGSPEAVDREVESPEVESPEVESPEVESPKVESPRFQYNYLHDLESVWWVMVYTLYSNIPESTILEGDALKAHHRIRGVIFPHPASSVARFLFLMSTQTDQKSVLPQEFLSLWKKTRMFGDFLKSTYEALEQRLDFPAGCCFSNVHNRVLNFMSARVIAITFTGKVRRIPPRPVETEIPLATDGKRKFCEIEDEEGANSSSSKRGKRRRNNDGHYV